MPQSWRAAAKAGNQRRPAGCIFGVELMTCSDFKNLHQRRQTEHLACHGRHLAERTEDSFRLSLYAVGNFYAEVWRSAGEDAVLFIHVFERPSGLSDYLAMVRLPQL